MENTIIYTVLENGYVQFEVGETLFTVPNDPANSDYAAYCAWAIAEGIMEAPVIEPVITEPEAE